MACVLQGLLQAAFKFEMRSGGAHTYLYTYTHESCSVLKRNYIRADFVSTHKVSHYYVI